MPNFLYIAKAMNGQTKSGTLEARDLRELAQDLKGQGLVLVKADTKIDKSGAGVNIPFISPKVSLTEIMLMTRNLWIMVTTGLSLVKGFAILSAQSKSKKFKKVLLDIGEEISKGKSLSDAFKKYPDVFSDLYQSMIQAGEESGTLEEVLNTLSLQLEKEKEMKSKIVKALIYPIILIVIMLIVAICLSIFVLPKLNKFFVDLKADLPITTKIILGSGDFIMKYWYFFIIGFIGFAFAITTALRTKTGKFVVDSILLKIPLVSSLTKKSNTALLIRSLSSLLAAGVPLLRALSITVGTVNNYYFKQALRESAIRIEKGEKLSASLAPNKKIFPYGVLEIVEIGEETGKTSLILKKLAEFYEEEVTNIAESLSTIIEPAMIVLIGAGVGVFAVSIIGPMYSVLGNI